MKLVKKLSTEQVAQITLDARLVAIRWDLVKWGLVLDLDVPKEGVGGKSQYYRAWIVFENMSEIHIPLISTPLPNGCCLVSEIEITNISNNIKNYEFYGLIPQIIDNEIDKENVLKKLHINAKNVFGIISKNTVCYEDEFDPKRRKELASEADFLQMLFE